MKITKYTHSCLLVDTDGAVALFDPGNYTYNSGALTVADLPKLDYLVITHEHQDHFYLPLVQEICERYPGLTIVTTKSVASLLAGKVEVKVATESTGACELFKAPHENLPMGQTPENTGVNFAGQLTDPGDSHVFTASKSVLAMPMTAPWGSMTSAVKKIIELKPKYVIPIHDWHWRPEALQAMYGLIQNELQKHGIEFIIMADGQPVLVD